MGFTINGKQYDWTTLSVFLPTRGRVFVTVQSITYGHGMGKTVVAGNGKKPVGYGRDAYKADEVEIEMLMSEADSMRRALGPGYMEVEFGLVLAYADIGLPIRKDEIKLAHVVKEVPSVAQGGDPNKVKWTLQPMEVVMDGVQPVRSLPF